MGKVFITFVDLLLKQLGKNMRKLRHSASDEYKILFTTPYVAVEITGLALFIIGLIRI